MNTFQYILEEAISTNEEVCTSGGIINRLPKQFFKPFYYSGVGMIVCVGGGFSFYVDSEKYTCNEGMTVFIPYNKSFMVSEYSDNLKVYVLLYQIEPIRDHLGTTIMPIRLYSKISPDKYYVWSTGKEEDIISYISLIGAKLKAKGDSFVYYELKLLLMSVTYCICSVFQNKLLKSNPIEARRTEVFLDLLKLIDQYYVSERSVTFYANKLFLSPKYLSELSKSVCGYTVQEMVFKSIIRESKSLLKISNKTIQEISEYFNFPNASSFGTFFKKQVGMSPLHYRLLRQKDDDL